jgi:branched-chain amino acid transport system substrate-binding protein
MMRVTAFRVAGALFALLLMASACGVAGQARSQTSATYPDPGITDTTIKIGGSFALTGPLAVTAPLAKGMQAYFASVNAKGGVNGRKIDFTALDDGYDPARGLANMRQLVEDDQVFAVTGFGISQTASVGYLTAQRVPQVFVFNGDSTTNKSAAAPYIRSFWPDVFYEGYVDTQFALGQDPNARIGTIFYNNGLRRQ